MRNRHGEWTFYPDRLTPSFGATVQRDRRLTRARSTDLNFTPAHSTDAKTEHFGDGLFRRPPTGEMEHIRAAIHLLPLRVDTVQESAGMLLEHIPDASCLNDVDAYL